NFYVTDKNYRQDTLIKAYNLVRLSKIIKTSLNEHGVLIKDDANEVLHNDSCSFLRITKANPKVLLGFVLLA
ncbi:1643_t:CDS:1, partial [Racocetra persica]